MYMSPTRPCPNVPDSTFFCPPPTSAAPSSRSATRRTIHASDPTIHIAGPPPHPPPRPIQASHKPDPFPHRTTPPTPAQLTRQHNDKDATNIHAQPPPTNSHPPTIIPTIYIVTFATDTYPLTHATVSHLVSTQVPRRNPPVPHLYTLSCHSFAPPSRALCAMYSGIEPLIQDIVLCDPDAARAVRAAVKRLLDEGRRGVRECSMSVCCHAGTHRSVAVGERIAQGVKEEVKRVGGK